MRSNIILLRMLRSWAREPWTEEMGIRDTRVFVLKNITAMFGEEPKSTVHTRAKRDMDRAALHLALRWDARWWYSTVPYSWVP